MDYPWFEFGRRDNGDFVGEDIYFCEKLKKLGYKLHADTSIDIMHLSTVGINRDYHEIFMKIIEGYKNRDSGAAADG